MNKTLTFHVQGMHCNACVALTESELQERSDVAVAKANLANCSVEVTGDFSGQSPQAVADNLTKTLAPHGYRLLTDRPVRQVSKREFMLAAAIALACIAVFVVLQRLGLVNLISSDTLSYGSAALIGVIASVSSCMAVVGGLVLSMSATFAQRGQLVRPHLLFHASRLATFFVLGGVIGAIGSAFTLSSTATFVLSVVIGLVMLSLGFNLLDILPWTKRIMPSLPTSISKRLMNTASLNTTLTPALLGLATFFLPCGFTQSMQLYSLSTGSFLSGALTMLFFALGTLPVLSLVSFSSFAIGRGKQSGLFFKTAGFIVIAFGLFNILAALAAIGVLPPLLVF